METVSKEKRYLKRYEISMILQAIDTRELGVIIPYIDDKVLQEKVQELWETDVLFIREEEKLKIEDEYLKNIAAQISKEDYGFLEAQINKSNSSVARLIFAIGDKKYIKKCAETLDLDWESKIWFVAQTNDETYIKDFLDANKDKLNSSQKSNLIKATNNKRFIRECIYDNTLQLEDFSIAELIIATEEIEYIKSFIEEEKLELRLSLRLLQSTKEPKYIEKKLELWGDKLSNRDIVNVVRNVFDKDLIKKYINGTRLKINEKIELIQCFDSSDFEYIKNFISQNKTEIDEQDLIRLIKLTKNVDYITKIINGEEDLDLSDKAKTAIVLETKNRVLIQQYMNQATNLSAAEKKIIEALLNPDFLSFSREKYKRIELPQGMTIGMEIESEGKFSQQLPKLLLNGRWRGKKDGSLENGIEVVSTILNGTEQDSKEIYQICDLLVDIGQSTSERCGGHIHIGADFLTSKQAYFNLLEIYGNCEEIIYAISNGENINMRKGISKYCLPIAEKLEEGLESGALNKEDDLSEFIEQLKELQGARYSGINFMNVGTVKNTIEFRIPNGTINPDTWIENVNLFGGIIKAAQELAIIQSKAPHEITDEEKAKLMWLSKIKSPNIDANDKLNALLSLTVQDKEPYIGRYSKNIELMQADEEIAETMKKARTSKPIDFRKIGATVLAGNDPVRGDEVLAAEVVFRGDVEQAIEGEKNK